MKPTRDRILDIAECLFGERGYESTSLRQVIFEAGVNLAAVHYHFGSKQELLDAIVLRGAVPLNEERIALLDRYEKEASPGPVPVDRVLRALLAPTFQAAERKPQFVKLMGRLYGEGLMPALVARHFSPQVERFMAAMQRSLPDLPAEELFWRVQFMFGAMAQVLRGPHLLPAAKAELGTPTGEEMLERLVGFLVAGFQAPASVVAPVQER